METCDKRDSGRVPIARARIVIISGNHLCHNPRVLKEAATLAAVGYRVTVLGAWLDPDLKKRDQALIDTGRCQFIPVIDATNGGAPWQVLRARRKLASLLGQGVGVENAWQLGGAYPALRRTAFRSEADLYIAHSEQGMAVALDLMREGRCVAVDMEDWYSEDLPPEARRKRPIRLLRNLERELLRHGAYASCPSAAMSGALAAAYDCSPPRVVYNAFPWTDRAAPGAEIEDRRERAIPSIHWFSQTIGPGRGLEDLFAALPLIDRAVELHLRGTAVAGLSDWLAKLVPGPVRARVFVRGLVTNDKLAARISEHDIGFAGEQGYSRSRETTVTNKILQYLLGGLAVVASDTEGQREVARQAEGAVHLYPPGDPAALAGQINTLLGSPERLARAKAAALRAAEERFCWERQAPVLLAAVEQALARSRRAAD